MREVKDTPKKSLSWVLYINTDKAIQETGNLESSPVTGFGVSGVEHLGVSVSIPENTVNYLLCVLGSKVQNTFL